MKNLVVRGLLKISLPLALVVDATAAEEASTPSMPDGGEMCAEMMQTPCANSCDRNAHRTR
jgi:hypothetical protein